MDEVDDAFNLLSTTAARGKLVSAKGQITKNGKLHRGLLSVEERSISQGVRGREELAGLNIDVDVVMLWEDDLGEEWSGVELHFADVMAVSVEGERKLKFYAHGGGMLTEFEGDDDVRKVTRKLVLDNVLQPGPDDLFVPSAFVGRRIFEDHLDDSRLKSSGSLTLLHSLSDITEGSNNAIRAAKRSVMRTFAHVPRAVRWFTEVNRPILSELGFSPSPSSQKQFEISRRTPTSPADLLKPVFHIAKHRRGVPVTLDILHDAFDAEGRLKDREIIHFAIQAGGLTPEARREAWPFVIGLFSWSSSQAERKQLCIQLRGKYEDLSNRSSEKLLDDPSSSREVLWKEQIRKDVDRTDRSVEELQEDDAPLLQQMEDILCVYANSNPEIGYCQGMSDLLSPILWVLREEHPMLSFWCFTERMKRGWYQNFKHDGSGIKVQLELLKDLNTRAAPDLAEMIDRIDPNYHCLYRWILVQFKRELSFSDVARLWEVLWLDSEPEPHLYVALGLLLRHRDQILKECTSFDRFLKYINLMSERMDVDLALHDANNLRRKYPLKSES